MFYDNRPTYYGHAHNGNDAGWISITGDAGWISITGGSYTTVANLWVDPAVRKFEEQLDKFISASKKRLAQLYEWTRRALEFWRTEHRRPVRVALPLVRLPERSRVCSLAEAWRALGPP